MQDWFKEHGALLWWLTAGSVLIFVLTLVAVPMVVARIPSDYFTHDRRPRGAMQGYHPVLRVVLLTLKNMAGVLLMLAGIAMLVLPGQGLVTLLIGFLLIDFPGKYRYEKWLVSRRRVAASINWLRKRSDRPPLEFGGGG